MLYDILLTAPRADTNTTQPKPGPHADGVIGSVDNAAVKYHNISFCANK